MNSASIQANTVKSGDRRELARAITLIESTRPDHRTQAEALLTEVMPSSGNSIRIGISGVPGVGKSTFIEAFGLHLIELGHKVCVLAVDPSSPRTGGSILGDKTRMELLSRSRDAFIRPSPSSGTLGGVARRTREAILVCEAAGFDVILVETVGVGQSETAVANLVDMFLLLIAPGGGDELQGIKKGIVELADLVVVNKADGDLLPAAERAKRDYGAALHLLRAQSENWHPKTLLCSSVTGAGINEVWNTVEAFKDIKISTDTFKTHREQQAIAWMWDEIHENLNDKLKTSPAIATHIPILEREVQSGKSTPTEAARKILDIFKI
ncbi:MAG: methylmalonyl Co-A mutase-associated GTPase MeaB [Rhodospirillales bacterium]